MSLTTVEQLERFDWQAYEQLGEVFRERGNVRLTYDRGSVQIVILSPEHEKLKHRLGRLIEVLAEELDLRLEPGGSMTFKREDLAQGLEPDECFWIAHEEQVRGRAEWDPARDPPPDLVVEIEISRSVLDRLGIYAALGVPEIWCCDGETLRVLLLQADGSYRAGAASAAFPEVPAGEITSFLRLDETRDYLGIVREFRRRVRELTRGTGGRS